MVSNIGRWERGEPIKARAVTSAERVYRSIKRNRIVSTLLAATAVGLVLATGFGIKALREATNARISEQQARTSEATAVASQEQTEATLARSNYFLAQARWKDNRIGEAIDLLQAVPQKHRNFEWYLACRQFDESQFCYWGHSRGVLSVSFSPDGTSIASSSKDGTIKIWDAATGKKINTLRSALLLSAPA
jgi:hypothetical protein